MPKHHLMFAQDLFLNYLTDRGFVWFSGVPHEGIGRSTINVRWARFIDLLKQKLVEAKIMSDDESVQVEYSFIAWQQTPVVLNDQPVNFKWSGEIVFTILAGCKYITLTFTPECVDNRFTYSHEYDSYNQGQVMFWFDRESLEKDGVDVFHQNFVNYIVKYFSWVERNRD